MIAKVFQVFKYHIYDFKGKFVKNSEVKNKKIPAGFTNILRQYQAERYHSYFLKKSTYGDLQTSIMTCTNIKTDLEN